MYKEPQLKIISKQFQIYGEILHAELCKIGHINETYTATYTQGGIQVRYIHQKINQSVFRDPVSVMNNVMKVTCHLRQQLEMEGAKDVTRKALTVVPTREGKSFYRDEQGDYWRSFVFVEGVRTFEAVDSPEQAFQAGNAIGNFQRLLAALPHSELVETIPYFHEARRRFDTLQKAIDEDRMNRAKTAALEIQLVQKYEPLVDVLLQAHAAGEIPLRITHNDTKFNNVMLDVMSGEQMCVVDLDTVMPGLVLYDFGDMVRTTTSPTLEDELDLDKVEVQMPLFEALARGYIEATHGFLTPAERSYVTFSGKLMCLIIGMRFLTDYLMGDVYFRVHRHDHNLVRSRTQFKLIQSIESREDTMQNFVASL